MSKTIRLLFPEWQGGNNPTYFLGAQLLAWLAPKNHNQKEIKIPIEQPKAALFDDGKAVVGQKSLKKITEIASEKIRAEQPDKIITLGGDCLVSQAPFDYLHGKYGDELGIIWIDAHPDISDPTIFNHEHAMVLGNLMGKGDSELAALVNNPYSSEAIFYVGLQEPTEAEKRTLASLKMADYLATEGLDVVDRIKRWLEEGAFKQVAIHLDLDVLDPKEFRMIYFAEPLVQEYAAVSGKMTLKELSEIMSSISMHATIVGLTIAEFLPWDVQNLQRLLGTFEIFQ